MVSLATTRAPRSSRRLFEGFWSIPVIKTRFASEANQENARDRESARAFFERQFGDCLENKLRPQLHRAGITHSSYETIVRRGDVKAQGGEVRMVKYIENFPP